MKIDFHIHTQQNPYLDEAFAFNLPLFKVYVTANKFEAVAITNHNLFNKKQFLEIKENCNGIGCAVFPGIEISLESGHILIISDANETNYAILEGITKFIQTKEIDEHYKMSISDFNDRCCGHNFLLIPHFEKSPKIRPDIISKIRDLVSVGEVDSPKKFFSLQKQKGLTPVYFSDIRIGRETDEKDYEDKSRFTYLDCSEAQFSFITRALQNRTSVALTKSNLPDTFDILNGQALACTGINVLLGKRSSGKTFTLNHLAEKNADSVLFIEQFEVSRDCEDTQFKNKLRNEALKTVIEYCKEYFSLLNYVDGVGVSTTELTVTTYLTSLMQNAERKLQDEYSLAPLFNYQELPKPNLALLESLVKATITLLDAPSPQKELIEEKLSRSDLISLYELLIQEYKMAYRTNSIVELANQAMKNVSTTLGLVSNVVQIQNLNFSNVLMTRYIRKKFDDLHDKWKKKVISTESTMNKFEKTISFFRQTNKTKLKTSLGILKGAQIDYLVDKKPIDAYLESTEDKNIKYGAGDDRFRLFFDYEVSIQNADKKDLSGGQRAEYSLLNKLQNYQRYEVVLIDEMESSFDNPFLNKEIIELINNISKCATVFISTHNNNLGVSLCPDFYIFHQAIPTDTGTQFHHYCGKASDERLKEVSGEKVRLSDVLVETMEANTTAYNERKTKYEASKN